MKQPMHHLSGDETRAREARAILTRVSQETDPQIGAGTQAMLGNALGHFSARDVDQGDRIELIGTRIGRLLGLAAFLVLAVSLVTTLVLS